MNLDQIRTELNHCGLNLFSVLDHQCFEQFAELQAYRSLILIGNAGPWMWRRIPEVYFAREHPVDEYATDAVNRCLSRYAEAANWQLLFPGADNCPSLQTLGNIAGWHSQSPLGVGINPQWGLWFAYRAVVAVSVDLAPVTSPQRQSPCLSCVSRACISECPGRALAEGEPPDLLRCTRYRLRLKSDCAATCVARLACPIAADLRYDEVQINYHYRLALPALSRWLGDTDSAKYD